MKHRDLGLASAFLALVIVTFGGTSLYISHRARALNEMAVEISELAAPSVLDLSAARTEVRHLKVNLARYGEQARNGMVPSATAIEAQRARIHDDVRLYQQRALLPGERALWDGASRELLHLDGVIDTFLSFIASQRLQDADELAQGELAMAIDHTADALAACLEFNAQQSRVLAQQIRHIRTTTVRSAMVLNALCVLWPVALALLITYVLRGQAARRDAQRQRAMERADELEQFAGRVAHDLRNPLSSVNLMIQALELAGSKDVRTDLLTRGRSNVRRMQQLIDALLQFACSGAQPEPGARADVREVMAGLEAELGAQAAKAEIEFRVLPFPSSVVACTPGILTSLIQNLTDNAIKYMGEGTTRSITIRVLEQTAKVRFEIEDTGPGLPPGMEKAIFNPHVRVRGSAQPGFGLGLATVKKAVEAHGGRVDVHSVVGHGCQFWFELPKDIGSIGG